MADIRKRKGAKGVTYQVRYPSKSSKSGYTYATFDTLKEAREFREDSRKRERSSPASAEIRTVTQAIDKWLDICAKEGRDGRDPVTTYTKKQYDYRANMMRAYQWSKGLHELSTPDIVEFRSWLLKSYSRDQARKVLSSFHSVLQEMASRGFISSNVAAGINIRGDSRYDQPVVIPSPGEVQALLSAADRLANSKNKQISATWERYRPVLYLAADSGMRPQEYLVVAGRNLRDGGVFVDRAIERGGYKISVTKTPAGRRFVELTPEVFDMVARYRDRDDAIKNDHDLVFPTSSGQWLGIENWRNRAFNRACIEAGLIDKVTEDGSVREKPKYTPYHLRHFYASMLIENRVNLKKIQSLMGHADINTTLNVYGHLIERAENANRGTGMIGSMRSISCGKSVANSL